jgi:1,4-dihydroxy-6-naphthoate synthase
MEGMYDISAISSVIYPLIAQRYAILSAGTSVGRGYGPVLVSKRFRHVQELARRRVGVGGIPTTGWLLLRWLCPEAVAVEMPFDQVGAAVLCGEVDAGVMIHEELLYYPRLELHRVADLGAEWCRQHDLPLPVGLNVIRRDLGMALMQRVCAAIRRSLECGWERRDEALAWVSRFGRGAEGQCAQSFVEMFANRDSVWMPVDVRQGLNVLLNQAVALGVADRVPPLEIIEGLSRSGRSRQMAA